MKNEKKKRRGANFNKKIEEAEWGLSVYQKVTCEVEA